MKIIRNNILPLGRRYVAINLFGILFVKRGCLLSPQLINHESIHTRQMLETGIIFFYLLYIIEWIIRLFQTRFDTFAAYHKISFEREAYTHGDDLSYLSTRRPYAMWRRRDKFLID